MKRTALRRTALRRGTRGLRRRLPKRVRLYGEPRRRFVAEFLRANPNCTVRWDERCWGRATTVHEYIPWSKGGAVIPGPEAEAQGQKFWGACLHCHDAVHALPKEARSRGWLTS